MKIIRPVDFAVTDKAFERSREIHERHGIAGGEGHHDIGMDHDYPDDECPNCGGAGFVYDCIDGFCEDAESGCDLCERACDWCTITNPAKP